MYGITTIRSISRSYRHARRYKEILAILVKNGFGFLFENLHRHNPFYRFRRRKITEFSLNEPRNHQRLLDTVVELGPTFVKLGQMLSCRPDLLPDELLQSLSRLQAHVPPFPFDIVRTRIREELGAPIEELFATFDETPSGSASIAQGHRATLKDGRKVFVKIQRPDIVPKVQVDLEIIADLAAYLERSFPELAVIQPTHIIEDFRSGFLDELDFLNEAANMRAFGRQFEGEAELVVPQPVASYCTRRVLTMTCIDGFSINSVQQLREHRIDCEKLAGTGVRLLLEQIFKYGFFHGDPHPGNMLVIPEGSRLAYVDFGVMGRLTIAEREALCKITTAMLAEDMHEMTRHVLDIASNPAQVDTDGLERDLGTLVASHLHGNVAELNVVQFTLDFYKICYRRQLCLKPHFCRMMRALGYADAIGRKIAPQFNIYGTLRPFMQEQAAARLNPFRHYHEVLRCLNDWLVLFQQAPLVTQELMQRTVRSNRSLEHRDSMRQISDSVRRGSRQLADAMLLSVFALSATLFILGKAPPLYCGFSLPGGLTFLFVFIIVLIRFCRRN